eukprot:PhM_4_TR12510/c0_g2_i1/m.14170
MIMHFHFVVLLVLISVTTALARKTPHHQTLIRVGVLDNQKNIDKAFAQWSPTFDAYINHHADRLNTTFRTTVVALSFDDLTAAAQDKSIDIVFTNPGHSAYISALYNFTELASLENMRNGQAQSVFGGVVFTHDRSDVTSILECVGVGRRLAAVSARSFGAFAVQMKEIHDQGGDVASLLSVTDVRFLGSHEAVINAINTRSVDCGFIRTDKFESNTAKNASFTKNLVHINPKQSASFAFFPFLVSTDLYPEWIVTVNPSNVSLEDQKTLQQILYSVRGDSACAVAGKYSRWFPPVKLTDVFEVLYVVGDLPRPSSVHDDDDHDDHDGHDHDHDHESSLSSTQAIIIESVVSIVVGPILFGVLVYFLYQRYVLYSMTANAPKDAAEPIHFMFVSLKRETSLWESFPDTMPVMMAAYKKAVAASCRKTKCYQVKFVGDAVFIAARSAQAILNCAKELQLTLPDDKALKQNEAEADQQHYQRKHASPSVVEITSPTLTVTSKDSSSLYSSASSSVACTTTKKLGSRIALPTAHGVGA